MKNILFLSLVVLLFSACGEKSNEDIVKEPNKEGSIETVVSVKHDKGFDILTTTHKIWVKNKLDKTLIKIDTLTSLGTTLVEGEDENGNSQKAMVPKDYEFYITVK
jgi:uncharacterized protein YjbK